MTRCLHTTFFQGEKATNIVNIGVNYRKMCEMKGRICAFFRHGNTRQIANEWVIARETQNSPFGSDAC